jgi:hypothetical protein
MCCRARIAALLALTAAACADPDVGSRSLGVVAPATGPVSLAGPASVALITGFAFDNQGTSDVTIGHVHVVLAGGEVIDSDVTVGEGFSFGVPAGETITYVFDHLSPRPVVSVAFAVGGTTEVLEVFTTDATGVVPTIP